MGNHFFVSCQQQEKFSNDCGLFVIANAVELLHNFEDVVSNLIEYDVSKMRGHLKKCLIAGKFIPFPRKDVQLDEFVDNHLEDDGIEAFGPRLFTKAYFDECPPPPQKLTCSKACPGKISSPFDFNPKVKEFEHLKQSSEKVTLSEIPSIGFIDVVYVEKYFNLFLKSVENHPFKNKFLSPLSIAQIGAGLNPKDGFPSFRSSLKG